MTAWENTEAYWVEREDLESLPLHHRLVCADWYLLAKSIIDQGHDLTVYDPDSGLYASQGAYSSTWWDGVRDHGVLTIKPTAGSEWWLRVRRCDAFALFGEGYEPDRIQ